MLPDDPPVDPAERLRIVVREITDMTRATEPALRTMLRLSLEGDEASRRDLPLRKGRRLAWVAEALAPLAETMTPQDLDALVLEIAATCGIEVHIWLTDVAGPRRGAAARGIQRADCRRAAARRKSRGSARFPSLHLT